ncbi:hypothetical protein [Bombella saccharophila]|uniref:Uncharacterized protein n=1 Tax=Bombella saccharophila TaxID=2967338 RepID=A0ABT3W899_9PROT|nr:hypothetical protein [Bombella saccharophila]MCX5614550.1 hypothetical protein [Bombella saccharophila]
MASRLLTPLDETLYRLLTPFLLYTLAARLICSTVFLTADRLVALQEPAL